MKKFFFNPRYYFDGPGAVGILFLRVFLGYAMATYGLQKLQSPGGFSGWMGPSGPPPFLQGLATFSEFFGGLAIMFGVLTPLACLGVMSTMFVAMMTSWLRPESYLVAPHGLKDANTYGSAATYFFFALAIFLTGPGILSVDAALTKMMGLRVRETESGMPVKAV